jgi:lysophospholipase L1-like esterase
MSLTNKVAQFDADSDLVNAWVHGPASGAGSTVTTDSGTVRTPAKLIADQEVNFADQIDSLLATSTVQAGIATTQAGISTTQAGLSATARIAAEAARDASLIQAGVYTTEALGRAAVADGQAFKVQGSGDVAAYEYRRTNSTTSVLIATYPSYAGVTAYSQGGSADLRVGIDLAATLTWTTGITAGSGGKYSGFVAVTPKATVLKLVITNNYDTTRPNVLGYNAAQQPVQTLLANGTVNATALSPAYVTIPDGIAYVKICGGGASTPALVKKMSIEDIVTENLQTPYLNSTSGNEFAAGKTQYKSDDTVAVVSGNGTGYVPVQVGDTIRYRGYAISSFKAAGFFDSGKNFLRRWLGDVSRGTVYEYTLNAVDDANVAFVVATDYQPDGTGFFTVERNKNPITKINDRTFANAFDPLYGRAKAVDSVLSGATKATAGLKFPRYTITANPGYITFNFASPSEAVGHSSPFVAVKIKLISLPSGSSTSLSWYNLGSTLLCSAAVTLNVGDTVTMWAAAGTRHITSVVIGAVFDIIDSVGFLLDSDYAATLSNNEKTAIISDPLVFKRDYMLANYSKNSAASDKINTIFKTKRLVTFGDSVMASFGVPKIVADNLQMSLTQLAVSGSSPYANSNLSDTQLALVPDDATLVIITGGANLAAVISGDITTRDRTKGEGTINYAMDWIYTNRPSCRIMLATPPTRNGASLNWAQVFRDLATYRKVPLADMDRDCDINQSNYTVSQYDGVHPTAEGISRMAGVLIGAIKRVIY